MLNARRLLKYLNELNINFFTGVPDSLLKAFCRSLCAELPEKKHVIAADEGNAVALAAGYHIATGGVSLVYMQNSGLGNAINPLLSLTEPRVFAIPLLLLIGWRGEPGTPDEPQHLAQGEATLPLLEAMRIPYVILNREENAAFEQFRNAIDTVHDSHGAYALIVRRGTFEPDTSTPLPETDAALQDVILPSRENVIEAVVEASGDDDLIFCTTGMAGRELYEIRERGGMSHEQDFLMTGSMGHVSQIARGVAMQRPYGRILCLDGDGAALMHLGGLAGIGCGCMGCFIHIILNNGAHDSVGGQPTLGWRIDWPALGRALGYDECYRIESPRELTEILKIRSSGSRLIEVRCRKGARPNLGRPRELPTVAKAQLMTRIAKERVKHGA